MSFSQGNATDDGSGMTPGRSCMKVNDRNAVGSTPEGARSPEARRVENSASSRTASSHGASGLDRVELSTAAEGISRALAVDSSERAARVSAIAMDYRAGRYHPDAQAASRGLIAEALATGMA